MRDKKTDILNAGRELFSAKGFKDTNVSDIARMAGIGVGTFYNYYPSKEQLFLDIFLDENVKLKKRIMAAVDRTADPLVVVRELMALNLQGMNENPILREWYNRDVFDKIEQKYREENGISAVSFLYGSFADLIAQWQAEGKTRDDIDVDLIMAMFVALITIDTHKEEIGSEHFPQILDHLVEFVIKGLMNGPTAVTGPEVRTW